MVRRAIGTLARREHGFPGGDPTRRTRRLTAGPAEYGTHRTGNTPEAQKPATRGQNPQKNRKIRSQIGRIV